MQGRFDYSDLIDARMTDLRWGEDKTKIDETSAGVKEPQVDINWQIDIPPIHPIVTCFHTEGSEVMIPRIL